MYCFSWMLLQMFSFLYQQQTPFFVFQDIDTIDSTVVLPVAESTIWVLDYRVSGLGQSHAYCHTYDSPQGERYENVIVFFSRSQFSFRVFGHVVCTRRGSHSDSKHLRLQTAVNNIILS